MDMDVSEQGVCPIRGKVNCGISQGFWAHMFRRNLIVVQWRFRDKHRGFNCEYRNAHTLYPLENEHNYGTWPFIVSFPIKNCDFPWLCKRLPGGTCQKVNLVTARLNLAKWIHDIMNCTEDYGYIQQRELHAYGYSLVNYHSGGESPCWVIQL